MALSAKKYMQIKTAVATTSAEVTLNVCMSLVVFIHTCSKTCGISDKVNNLNLHLRFWFALVFVAIVLFFFFKLLSVEILIITRYKIFGEQISFFFRFFRGELLKATI